MSDPQTRSEPEELVIQRLSKVLADPMRVRIVAECSIEAMSPRSFHDAFGGPSMADTLLDFELLEQFGWLGPVAESPAPAERLDRLYAATEPPIFDSDWPDIPDATKTLILDRIVGSLSLRLKDALAAGTIVRRPDSHLTWTPLALDQKGWDAVIARVDALFYFLFEEQKEANLRMALSGEEPIATTVGLLGFESPRRAP